MGNSVKNGVSKILTVALLALAPLGEAGATLITFDDLVPPPEDCECDWTVTDQYLPLGLLVEGGGVGRFGPGPLDPTVSSPNVLTDVFGPSLRLSFVGVLPSFVSVYVSTSTFGLNGSVYLQANGPGGFVANAVTKGTNPPDFIPEYVPKQFVSFSSATGISTIQLDGTFSRRGEIVIDNLFFGAAPPVPEPSTYLMLGAGLLMLVAMRKNAARGTPARQTAAIRRNPESFY